MSGPNKICTYCNSGVLVPTPNHIEFHCNNCGKMTGWKEVYGTGLPLTSAPAYNLPSQHDLRGLRTFEAPKAMGWDWNSLDETAGRASYHSCYRDGHMPVENGTKRTWCRHCDMKFRYDFNIGWVIENDRNITGISTYDHVPDPEGD